MYYYTVGTFTVPLFSGTPPPPIAWFTLNNLQLQNKAIMFGGLVTDGNRVYCTNDCYVLTISNDQVVGNAAYKYTPVSIVTRRNVHVCTCMYMYMYVEQ